MNRSRLLTVLLLLAVQGVSADVSAMTATGRGAPVLASLVGDASPTIWWREQSALRQMFDGRAADVSGRANDGAGRLDNRSAGQRRHNAARLHAGAAGA
jgi:hypothetical protein